MLDLIDWRLARHAHNEIMDGSLDREGEPVACTCAPSASGGSGDWIIDESGRPYCFETWPIHTDNCAYLINLLARTRDLMERSCYVNVYLRDRAYGGPEEGGWWFDTREVIAVFPCDDALAAHQLRRRLEDSGDYSNEGRNADVSSVACDGCYTIDIEFEPGTNAPERRPHYE